MKMHIFILSLFLCVLRCPSHAEKLRSQNSEFKSCDAIFLERYLTWFFHASGESVRTAMGDSSGPARTEQSQLKEEIGRLPIDQKCRLVILLWFSLPLDGETSETFGNLFGDDRGPIARRLKLISDKELLNLCARMGFGKEKVAGLKRKLAVWEAGTEHEVGTKK